MRLLFFGTPQEAVPFLEAIAGEHEIVGVITRADRPAGRGLALMPPPIKESAQKLKIPVLQPNHPKDILSDLQKFKADLAVVVAYGKILSKEVLKSTRLGFINVHFSLLPKYRGAAPIEWVLIRGETKTGVTVFWLDEGLDTGAIQARSDVAIGIDDDSIALRETLINLGVSTLRKSLEDIERGVILRVPQAGETSAAPKLKREDAAVDFDRSAVDLHNRVRGLTGSPRAFIRVAPSKSTVVLLKTSLGMDDYNAEEGLKVVKKGEKVPGTVISIERKRGILIQCQSGQIWIVVVQPEGKRQIPAADFANGLRLKPGDRLAYFSHD